MSLLMDALKRAEKARQAEASSDGAEIDPASTQGFSLDPIDDPAAEEARAPARTARPIPPADEGVEFELENTSHLRSRLGEDRTPPPREEPDPGEDIELHGLDDDSLSLDGDDVSGEGVLPEDTAATLPSVKSARRSVSNYFDGTGSGSASLTVDDLQAAMLDETQRRERVSADTDTQRRVRAVFHAKEAGRGRRGRNWAVIAAVPVLLILIVAGVVFVFWDTMTEIVAEKPAVAVPRNQPRVPPPADSATARTAGQTGQSGQPVAQAGQTAGQTGQTAGQATAQAGQATGQATQATQTSRTSPATEGSEAGGVTIAGSDTGTTGPANSTSAVTKQLMAGAPSMEEVTGAQAGAAETPADTGEKVAASIRARGLAKASPAGDSAFKIRRRSVTDRLHPQLMDAYGALRAGDFANAKRGYEAVLKSDPRNRDAQLGLAAIAVGEGDWDTAGDLYVNLLRLNPRDSVAQAALISMRENVDPLRGESRIKLLLREEPQAAYLHFTLGNLYAEQGRWAEAQSSYFNAFRLRPDNADYAYNLAVSLDQLSKTSNAIDYYRQALALAGTSRAAFEPAAVLARIQSMSTGAQSQ